MVALTTLNSDFERRGGDPELRKQSEIHVGIGRRPRFLSPINWGSVTQRIPTDQAPSKKKESRTAPNSGVAIMKTT